MPVASPLLSFQKYEAELPKIEAKEDSLVSNVARQCLIELGISLAIGVIVFPFTATLLEGTLLFVAIGVQTIANGALRFTGKLAEKGFVSKTPCISSRISSASSYLSVTLFAYLSAINAQMLFHEAGHAITASFLFKNAHPRITITPCLGGLTRFRATDLTQWGEKLGRSGALLAVALMGPVSTLLISGVAIVVGYVVQTKFPEFGDHLIRVGKGDFYAHSFYALTALSSSPPSIAHDFSRLKSFGISPLASAAVILAIPILISRSRS